MSTDGPETSTGTGTSRDTGVDTLAHLVDAWVNLPDMAEQMQVPITRVRQLMREGRIVAVPRGDRNVLQVPAAFLAHPPEGGPADLVKGLTGVLNLLRDAGFDAWEAIEWLHTPEDSLPGTPIQALVENRGTEVKRRAQAQL